MVTNPLTPPREADLPGEQKSPRIPFPAGVDSLTFRHIARCCSGGDAPERVAKDIETLVAELSPQTPIEKMLVAQMVAVHFFVVKQLSTAITGSHTAIRQESLAAAIRLQKLFLNQINTLASLRGTKQQRVRIEHINISGGQSIIASQVENRGREVR